MRSLNGITLLKISYIIHEVGRIFEVNGAKLKMHIVICRAAIRKRRRYKLKTIQKIKFNTKIFD